MQTICLNKGDEMSIPHSQMCKCKRSVINCTHCAICSTQLWMAAAFCICHQLQNLQKVCTWWQAHWAVLKNDTHLHACVWMCKTFQVPKNVNLTHLIASVHEKSYASEKKSDLSCSTKSGCPPPVAPRNCQSNKLYFVIFCRNWLIKRDTISHSIT